MGSKKGIHTSTKTEFKKGNDMWTKRKSNIPWNAGKKTGQLVWNKGKRLDLNLELIKEEYTSNKKSTRYIANKLGVSKSYINKRLREMNIKPREVYDKSNLKVWNKGLTKETNEKVKLISKLNERPKSKQTIERISNTKKQYFLEYPEAKLRMKEQRASQVFPKKDSKIEIKIQGFLESLGIDYLKHKYMNIEHSYQCDIFIPSLNLVIECDGDYWHKYPTRRNIDNIRTSELIKNGFKVLRLWEKDIKVLTIENFKELI